MLNLEEFENLRENNRLEVKKATLVIPNSIWETYSAFCNTYGGTILLGVDEDKNSHLCTCGLTKKRAYSIVNDVWNTLNNPTKISVNVLSNEDIQVQKVGDDYIVVINVPQANSMYKPVFINNNPLYAYRRNHDGDYRCTMDEIKSLLRDNEDYSDDKNIIPDMDLSVINKDTLTAYKNAYKQYHNDNHPFANEDDPEFLIHIGAARKDSQGVVRPTKAGLLMFGNYYDITNVYHNYFLDYQDHRNLEDDETRWSLRITASYGDWSGNLYDFFNRIVYRLTEDIAVPFKMKGIYRDDSSIMKKAIREALCNTLSNADYHGGLSVVVTQYHDKIVFSNPGSLVLPLEQIYIGGQSKARNKTILNMFSFVNIGERAGSGFPLILKATKESNFPSPIIYDQFNPDCTILTIFITKVDSKVQNPNGSVQNPNSLEQNPNSLEQNPNGLEQNPNGLEQNPNGSDQNPNSSVQNPNGSVQKPNSLEQNPNGSEQNPNSLEQNPNGSVQNSNDNIKQLSSIINNLHVIIRTKKLLLIICNTFINTIFSRKDIINLTGIKKTQASAYIKILKDNDLIENVSVGKYKFKSF